MKEELCEKVVEVRRKSNRVMTVLMVLEFLRSGENYMCVWSAKWQNCMVQRKSIFMMI